MIETQRLLLRPWRDADREPFTALNADPEVAWWLGGEIDREQSNRAIDRYNEQIARSGFGKWAVECRQDGALIGAVGVMPVIGPYEFDGFELGWRMARPAWGKGYATEAARAALDHGLERAGLTEIIAFTSDQNLRSIAVMERIGMVRDPARDFEHPALAADHPLSRHVVYVAANRALTTA